MSERELTTHTHTHTNGRVYSTLQQKKISLDTFSLFLNTLLYCVPNTAVSLWIGNKRKKKKFRRCVGFLYSVFGMSTERQECPVQSRSTTGADMLY